MSYVSRSQEAENAALSSKVSAQNAKLEKLRVELTEFPSLKEKLANCKELSKCLERA